MTQVSLLGSRAESNLTNPPKVFFGKRSETSQLNCRPKAEACKLPKPRQKGSQGSRRLAGSPLQIHLTGYAVALHRPPSLCLWGKQGQEGQLSPESYLSEIPFSSLKQNLKVLFPTDWPQWTSRGRDGCPKGKGTDIVKRCWTAS